MPVITATQTWSEQNNMEAEILNVSLNYHYEYDDDVLVYDVCIKPPDHLWFYFLDDIRIIMISVLV